MQGLVAYGIASAAGPPGTLGATLMFGPRPTDHLSIMRAAPRQNLTATLVRPAARIFGTGGVAFFMLVSFGIIVFLVFSLINHH